MFASECVDHTFNHKAVIKDTFRLGLSAVPLRQIGEGLQLITIQFINEDRLPT